MTFHIIWRIASHSALFKENAKRLNLACYSRYYLLRPFEFYFCRALSSPLCPLPMFHTHICLIYQFSNTKSSSSSNNLSNTTAATPWDAGHHHYHSLAGSSGASTNKPTTSLRGTSFFSALDSALALTQPSTSQTAGVSVSLTNSNGSAAQVSFSR